MSNLFNANDIKPLGFKCIKIKCDAAPKKCLKQLQFFCWMKKWQFYAWIPKSSIHHSTLKSKDFIQLYNVCECKSWEELQSSACMIHFLFILYQITARMLYILQYI